MGKRFVLIPVFLILFSVNQALAYSERTTHPALTNEILDFSGGVSAEERSWVVQGSQLEDTPPRWINHFYDPVNNTGWTGAKAGDVPAEVLRGMTSVGATTPVSAIDWTKGCNTQSAYWANGGNRVWDKALDYYIQGNMKEAYTTLGHILHIVEDMAVPDHTRDDTHAQDLGGDTGSPYEQYTAKYDPQTIKQLNIAGGLKRDGLSAPTMSQLQGYLTTMAQYSNKYFFSKDTINDPKYPNPKINWDDGSLAYGQDENGTSFPIAKIEEKQDFSGQWEKAYFLSLKDSNTPIFDAYFTRLARQAVLNGAGIVALFKRQAEDAKTNSEFFVDERHAMSKVACDTGETLSYFNPMGIVSGFGNLLSSFMGQVVGTLRSGAGFVIGLITPRPNLPKTLPPQPENSADNGDTPTDTSGDFSVSGEASDPNDSPSPIAPRMLATATTSSAPATTSTPPRRPPSLPTSSTGLARIATTSVQALVYSGGGGGGGVSPTTPAVQVAEETSSDNNESSTSTSSGNSTSTVATSTSETATSSAIGRILISEIVFDGIGDGEEFVELYNPESSALNMSDWRLRYQFENSTTSHSLALIKSSSGDLTRIVAHGFFLLGFGGYEESNYGGLTADAKRTASLPKGSTQKVKIYLADSTEKEIDYILYEKTSASPGHSLERMASSGVCVVAEGENEFLGNGCAATDQFSERELPRPQNSKSLPEPREKPATPSAPGGGNIATYDSTSSAINLTWNPSVDAEGATSTIIYKLFDFASSSPALISTTTATTITLPAHSGQIFNLGLVAEDRDGLSSATSSINLTIPSTAPTKPDNFTAIFDESGMALDLSWSSSTDPDGNSAEITYEINVSTSTELSSSTWTGVDKSLSTRVGVSMGANYVLGVRAKDTDGNYSESNILNWNFPAGFNPNLLYASSSNGNFTFTPKANGTVDKITITDESGVHGACGNGQSKVHINGHDYSLTSRAGTAPEQYIYQISPAVENIFAGVSVGINWQGYFTYQPNMTQVQDWFNFGRQDIPNLMYTNYTRCSMPIATSTATLIGQ